MTPRQKNALILYFGVHVKPDFSTATESDIIQFWLSHEIMQQERQGKKVDGK